MDSPRPIFTEVAQQLRVVDDARAARSRSAACVPRARTFPIHPAITSASKQIWLMMHVAIEAFSNIAWIVSSSLIACGSRGSP